MVGFLLEKLEEWIGSLIETIKENPLKSLIAILAFFIVVPVMGEYLLSSYGLITLISYIFACIYGFSSIIHNPYRPIIWGVGFTFGAITVDLFFNSFLPTISEGNIVSIFSGIVILFVIYRIYTKSMELKSS